MEAQLELGERLKEAGQKTVLERAGEEYARRFEAAALELLARHNCVTSDAVVALIGMPPNHPNAVGAAMRSVASRNGLKVEGYIKSTRPSCHAAVVAKWVRA